VGVTGQTGLGPTQSHVKWVPGLSWSRKRPGRDADPSPPSSAEVEKQSGTIPLLSLRAFVACKKVETYLYAIVSVVK
jgi:hypothetical protein